MSFQITTGFVVILITSGIRDRERGREFCVCDERKGENRREKWRWIDTNSEIPFFKKRYNNSGNLFHH